MINQIIHGDCFDVLKNISDSSIDAVITDPPYGIGIAKWDSVINIPLFTSEVKRVCNGFYAFFGQMPTMVNWINEANNLKFHYCEHISWVKRISTPSFRLSRLHESIIIYSLSNKKFYQHKGNFEDVKLPGILYDVITIEGLDRHIKDLWIKIQTGEKERCGNKNGKSQDEFKRFKSPGDRSPRKVNFTNVWSFLPPSQRTRKGIYNHPTEKPLEVMKRLVEILTPENGTVLDPFCGSGTTALACKELGRNYICIEKELEYYQIACKRINQPVEHIPDEPIKEIIDDSPLQLNLF